jgi:hypothetical protein
MEPNIPSYWNDAVNLKNNAVNIKDKGSAIDEKQLTWPKTSVLYWPIYLSYLT